MSEIGDDFFGDGAQPEPEMRWLRVDHFNELRDAAIEGFRALKDKRDGFDALIAAATEEVIVQENIPISRDDIWALRRRAQDKLVLLVEALNAVSLDIHFEA